MKNSFSNSQIALDANLFKEIDYISKTITKAIVTKLKR